jgi:hypothetical protein
VGVVGIKGRKGRKMRGGWGGLGGKRGHEEVMGGGGGGGDILVNLSLGIVEEEDQYSLIINRKIRQSEDSACRPVCSVPAITYMPNIC